MNWIQDFYERRRENQVISASFQEIERRRQAIEQRKKVLQQEINEREGEIRNLDWEWDQTCDEVDKLLAARFA